MRLDVVGRPAPVMLNGDEGTTAPPREKRTNATGSKPRPGFATVTCSAVATIPLPATFVMNGLTGAYAKTGPFAKSPLAMFVTMVGPLEALHGMGVRDVTAMIWVPVTLIGVAGSPPIETVTDDPASNPAPSMVTRVPPKEEPLPGAIAVTTTFSA